MLDPVTGQRITRRMIRARRALFDKGHFDPISAAVATMVVEGIKASLSRGFALGSDSRVGILDAGCGEGHYIGRIRQVRDESQGLKAIHLGLNLIMMRVTRCAIGVVVSHDVSLSTPSCHPLKRLPPEFRHVLFTLVDVTSAEYSCVSPAGGAIWGKG